MSADGANDPVVVWAERLGIKTAVAKRMPAHAPIVDPFDMSICPSIVAGGERGEGHFVDAVKFRFIPEAALGSSPRPQVREGEL